MTQTSARLFSEHLAHTSDGSRVHIGFTAIGAGNLGLHVGENLEEVLENRRELESELLGGAREQGFIYLNQVHGTDIFDADSRPRIESKGSEPDQLLELAPVADAASSSQGVPLAIMVADCIPIVFVGEDSRSGSPIIGVAHAGRRGLLDGVIQREVDDLKARGAVGLRAWLGPSICGKCYEVPQQMRDESANLLPEVESLTSWGTPALDLPAGAGAILVKLLGEGAVSSQLGACTFENHDVFSHRGHTLNGEPAGRIAGLVWIEKN